jgi:pyruvate dehydrogenase E2 component (dihydrolipoamide acetyltransferase)
MIKEICLPEISENVDTADVIRVLVSPGDVIKKDDPIIEIETEKATVEVPSPYGGTVKEIRVKTGDTIKVGSVILTIETGTGGGERPEGKKSEKEPEKKDRQGKGNRKKKDGTAETDIKEDGEKHEEEPYIEPAEEPAPASPSVRRLARELGVDIHKVTPGGPDGRITDEDVKRYVKERFSRGGISGDMPYTLPDFSQWGKIERIPLSKIRAVIAENMKKTWRIIPHVNHFDKADITRLEEFRKIHRKSLPLPESWSK